MMASENDINNGRRGYKIGLYFSLSILFLIIIWSIISEIRWNLFSTPYGSLSYFDSWMIIGVIGSIIAFAFAFFTLGQYNTKLSRECKVMGGAFHAEERQIVAWWAIIIGSVLGMGCWDIVTMIHLALDYGILNIWNILVTVFDFGFWQMIFPVWALVVIGILKMGSVLFLYALAIKNIGRGTVCELAEFKKEAIFD